ncbi:hypothetical protein GCM10028778_26290 [Barrientosiimonas marina]|uniref:ABC-2 family transporter protein n=1 Tax=Lentibacillus kimchii TaxID=1542911 RepID=A0ABW2UU71_9BACI
MKRFVKLLNFELSRFMKIYLVLAAFTAIVQITGVIVKAKQYLGKANEAMTTEGLSQAQFLDRNPPMSFLNVTQTLWFVGPIAICAAALIFYIFMIWYRDWFGKNTFIYRLLMLPTTRMNIYLSKASSIVLMTLGLISFELILLPLEMGILKWMLPVDFWEYMSVNQILNWNVLTILIPHTFTEFILYYGAGFMAVSVLFTAVLFERSFRWKGIAAGIIYALLSLAVMLSPFLVKVFADHYYLYPLETIWLEIGLGLVVTAGSLWTGYYLLTKKITV